MPLDNKPSALGSAGQQSAEDRLGIIAVHPTVPSTTMKSSDQSSALNLYLALQLLQKQSVRMGTDHPGASIEQ